MARYNVKLIVGNLIIAEAGGNGIQTAITHVLNEAVTDDGIETIRKALASEHFFESAGARVMGYLEINKWHD